MGLFVKNKKGDGNQKRWSLAHDIRLKRRGKDPDGDRFQPSSTSSYTTNQTVQVA